VLKFAIMSLILLFLHVGFASSQTTIIRISPENQSVSPQQDFTVSVVVDPGTAIAGAQFNLTFDPSLVTVVSVSEGDLFSQKGANTYFKDPQINNETGEVVGVAGVVLGPNTVSSSGTLAIIHMRAKSTEGTFALAFENVKIVDENGATVATTIQTGTVTISGTHPDNTSPGASDNNVSPEGGEISLPVLAVGGVILVVLGIITAYMLTHKSEKWEMLSNGKK